MGELHWNQRRLNAVLTSDTLRGGAADLAEEDFAFEGAEDDHAELHCQGSAGHMIPDSRGMFTPLTFTMPVP